MAKKWLSIEMGKAVLQNVQLSAHTWVASCVGMPQKRHGTAHVTARVFSLTAPSFLVRRRRLSERNRTSGKRCDATRDQLLPEFHNGYLCCANESLRSRLTLREEGQVAE